MLAAVEEIEKRLLPADDPAKVHPWSIEEMAAVDGFTDVEQRDLPSVATTTAADFVGRLSTVSAYLMLGPTERAEALRQVRAVLPDQVEIDNTLQRRISAATEIRRDRARQRHWLRGDRRSRRLEDLDDPGPAGAQEPNRGAR